MIKTPFVINDFDIDKTPLGSGYIAQIFKAFHRPSNKFFALKRIEVDKANTTEKIALKREEKLHSTLNHPNIVHFEGSFYYDNKLYFVLELVDGQELFKYIQESKDYLSESKALYIIH